MAMSNAQAGTRGLSSGDWIRLKRIRGAATSSVDTAFPQVAYPPHFHKSKVVGTSKIKSPASNWTDFKAFNTADYVLQSALPTNATKLTHQWVRNCKCSTPIPTLTVKKVGLCNKCKSLI